jgi:hypothetical protein
MWQLLAAMSASQFEILSKPSSRFVPYGISTVKNNKLAKEFRRLERFLTLTQKMLIKMTKPRRSEVF